MAQALWMLAPMAGDGRRHRFGWVRDGLAEGVRSACSVLGGRALRSLRISSVMQKHPSLMPRVEGQSRRRVLRKKCGKLLSYIIATVVLNSTRKIGSVIASFIGPATLRLLEFQSSPLAQSRRLGPPASHCSQNTSLSLAWIVNLRTSVPVESTRHFRQ
jgi:hypothetical protein